MHHWLSNWYASKKLRSVIHSILVLNKSIKYSLLLKICPKLEEMSDTRPARRRGCRKRRKLNRPSILKSRPLKVCQKGIGKCEKRKVSKWLATDNFYACRRLLWRDSMEGSRARAPLEQSDQIQVNKDSLLVVKLFRALINWSGRLRRQMGDLHRSRSQVRCQRKMKRPKRGHKLQSHNLFSLLRLWDKKEYWQSNRCPRHNWSQNKNKEGSNNLEVKGMRMAPRDQLGHLGQLLNSIRTSKMTKITMNLSINTYRIHEKTITKDSSRTMFLSIPFQKQKLKIARRPRTHFHLLAKNLEKGTITTIPTSKIFHLYGKAHQRTNSTERTLLIQANPQGWRSPHQLKLSSQSCKSPFAF